MKKRFWALFLAVMMVVSILPTSALAADYTEGGQAPADGYKVGDTYTGTTAPEAPAGTEWVQVERVLTCTNSDRRHDHKDSCYSGYVYKLVNTIKKDTTSTIKFVIVNGTWNETAMGTLSGSASIDGNTVTFPLTWRETTNGSGAERKGYVYDCESVTEDLLASFAKMDSSYITANPGYALGSTDMQDWAVNEGGGLIYGEYDDANAQIQAVGEDPHEYDTTSKIYDAYYADTVYTLTLQPVKYHVVYALDGEVDSIIDSATYYHSATKNGDSTISVTEEKPEKDGYVFTGWKLTGVDGTFNADSEDILVDTYWNTEAVVGDIDDCEGIFTFTAQWEEAPEEYTVTYNANGGYGAPAAQTKYHNVDLTLSNIIPTRTGYAFAGWSGSDGKAYQPKDIYTANANLTLTAQWTAEIAKIVFEENGGTDVADMTGVTDQTIENTVMPVTTKTGHEFKGWYDNAALTGEAVANLPAAYPAGTTTYYAKWSANSYSYTVEYYYDGGIDNSETETNTAEYGAKIKTYTDKNLTGYKLEKTENLPLTISDVAEKNVIKVYYIVDNDKTKTLTYTVEYYKDDAKVTADTQTVTQTVQILQPDTLTVDKTAINVTNKYTGYKFDKTEPAPIPDTIADNGVIKVYYVKDESKTKEVAYTVQHKVDGTVRYSERYTDEVWVNADEKIAIKEGSLDAKTYTGYKYDNNVTYKVSDVIDSGTTITLTYSKDDTQTKNLSYTVEYYKDNVKVDTQTETEAVWVNSTQTTLTVKKEEINTINKYEGFALDYTDPATIPTTIANEGVIKVYYATDVIGGEEGGDGIPDKYQATVTFKVVNGSWNDDKKADIKKVVTLTDASGKWAVNGTYILVAADVPTAGNNPDAGYAKGGTWAKLADNRTTPVGEVIVEDVTYTFNYGKPIEKLEVYAVYQIEHYLEQADGSYTLKDTDLPAGSGLVGSKAVVKEADYNTYEGYAFDKDNVNNVLEAGIVEPSVDQNKKLTVTTLKIYYSIDVIGGGEGGDEGDKVPDKYQITVNYVSADETMGTVSPAKEIIILTDEKGNWVETGNAALSGSTATAEAGYAFTKWMYQSITFVGSETLEFTIGGAKGGSTYTFTAYWTPIPVLDVNKTLTSHEADAQIQVGETITWKIEVKNDGAAVGTATLTDSITGVKIYTTDADDNKAAELTDWNITIQPKETITYIAEYKVTAEDKGKTLTNKVTLSDGDDKTKDPEDSSDPVKVENISVVKTPKSTNVQVGDTIEWIITVTNNGTKAVTITAPVDTLYDGSGNVIATLTAQLKDGDLELAVGESAKFSVTYKVENTAMLGKQLVNKAVVNGVEGTSPSVNVGPTYGVSITKVADDTSVKVGDKVTYTITVENTGNVDLTGVKVTDTFINGGKGKLTVKSGNLEIGKLAVDETATIILEYTTVSDDVKGLKNSAVVVTNETEGSASTEDVTVTKKNEPDRPRPSKPALNKADHYAYIVGYPDGLVHPEKNITRAEVSTIFFRMLLDESREDFWSQENWFSDVPADQWYNNAVSTLSNAGLITGYPDGSFKPNANITRAEFATIAIRFFLEEGVEITENNLSDVKGHWAEANINLAYALGLINGYPDGTFRPDRLITRAEAMRIVNRVLERAPHEDHLLEDMIEWPDNMDKTVWYYADVQEATNSHEFYKTEIKGEDEEYEIWTELLPVRDWAALEQMWSQANSSKNPGEVVDINISTPEAGN